MFLYFWYTLLYYGLSLYFSSSALCHLGSATALEDHQTFPSLSWSTLTATLVQPSMTELCPSLLFTAAGLHLESSVHVYNFPSSWHGQSPSTSHRVSLLTKWSLMLARESSLQDLLLWHVPESDDYKIYCSALPFLFSVSQVLQTAVG